MHYSILLPVLIFYWLVLVSISIATNFDYQRSCAKSCPSKVLWIFLGSVLAFVVMLVNTEFLWKITPWLYIFGLGLMVLPLVFIRLLWWPRRGKKLGQYWIGHPLPTIRTYEDIYILSFPGWCLGQARKEVTDLKDDWLLLFNM